MSKYIDSRGAWTPQMWEVVHERYAGLQPRLERLSEMSENDGSVLNYADEVKRLRAALLEIQSMTREFVDANHTISTVSASKAFWRIAHVEKIAREALSPVNIDREWEQMPPTGKEFGVEEEDDL